MSTDEYRSMDSLDWLITAATALTLVGIGLGGSGTALLAAIAGSLALVVARVRLTVPYAFALGQVTLLAALGGRGPIGLVVFAEVALFALLGHPMSRTAPDSPWRGVLASLLCLIVLGALGWGTLQAWDRLWAASLPLGGTGGLIAYLLHRYEQVQLGVVSSES